MRRQLPTCPSCGSHDVMPLWSVRVDPAEAPAQKFVCNGRLCHRDGEFSV